MFINDRTKKLIEIDRVLQDLILLTPYGVKRKSNMRPYENAALLCSDLEDVEKMIQRLDQQKPIFTDLRNNMRQLKDLRKSIEFTAKGTVLNTVELFEIKVFSTIIASIATNMFMIQWRIPEKYQIKKLEWIEVLLDPEKTGIKTFYLYDQYSEALAEIRKEKQGVEKQIDQIRRETIKTIEEELRITFKITGEASVSKKDKDLVEKMKDHKSLQITGETYMNINCKIKPTETILELQRELDCIKLREITEETIILERLSQAIAQRSAEILAVMDAIGELDLLMAKAYYATMHKCTKPTIREGTYTIKQGRHPIVEANLRKQRKPYKAIDITLDKGVTLITGANMGGKTVSLKLTALLLAMAHYGMFVPAEHLECPLCDHINLIAGDEQNIDNGLSTFGAEMTAINDMVRAGTTKGLILIDEIARGTNPHEGFAISASVINYLMGKEDMTMITTHYDGLVRPGIRHLQVQGLRNIDFSKLQSTDRIADFMDYSLIEISDKQQVPRDAINIAKLMGLPKEIISYAENIMEKKP